MTELFKTHPVMFRANPLGFILALILIPVGVGIFIFIYWFLLVRTTSFSISKDHVLYSKGILSRTNAEIDLDGIRTVRINQSLLNRMFDTGTVELYTAGDSPEIVAPNLTAPNNIRELIKTNQSN